MAMLLHLLDRCAPDTVRVMERLGIDRFDAVFRNSRSVAAAISNCLRCEHKEICGAWQTIEHEPREPPAFCPHAALLRRTGEGYEGGREDAVPSLAG